QALAATGGTLPYTWSVDSGALPAGLTLAPAGRVSGTPAAAGTFVVRFLVRDSAGASAAIDCAIGIRGSFQTSISAITFNGAGGGSVPPSQVLSLTSDEAGAPFSVNVTYDTGPPFLQLSSLAGTMPAAVSIVATTADLVGVQRATLTINSAGATPPTKVVTVTFNVGAAIAPGLAIEPAGFLVSTPRDAAVRNRVLFVTNKGSGRISFSVSASMQTGGQWLGVSQAGGSAGPNERFSIVVSFQARQVPTGVHRGTITISSPETGERLTANATLAVGAGTDALAIAPEGMTFYAVTGQDGVPPQPLRVISDGAGVINWQAAISYLGGPAGWLSLSQTAGATRPGSPTEVQASVNPRLVPAGVHSAMVDFTAPGAENSPRSALVVLNALGAGEDPGPVIQPGGLMFVSGGADPARQTIFVYNVSTRPFTFTPVLTGDAAVFNITTPLGRSVNPGARAAITVEVKAGPATQGVTRAALSLQFTNDPKVRVLDLLLILADGATPTVAARREANGCTPDRLEIVSVFPYRLNYTVAAGPPVLVSAIVRDNCGTPITDETAFVVTARPSTDPAPRLLRAAVNGFWTGDLVFRSTPSATITIDATNLNGSLKGAYQIGSATNAELTAPIVADGGVTSGASFVPFGPLAAGGIITVFGGKLADTTVSAPGLPLPQRLGGAELAVGGRVVPLFFASDDQVNGVLPFGADLYGTRQLVVRRSGGLPRLVEVNIRQAQPAIFILNQAVFRCDQAAVLDLQGRVPSSGPPCAACQPPQQCAPPIVAVTVARGEFISIFAEGLG
ncbi:MAG: BACON domain-containing protein, partial [Bryobacteraceae bacterium]